MQTKYPPVHSRQASRLVVLLLLLTSAGCQVSQHRMAWEKVYGISVNSSISLQQPLTIRPRHTQVFLQDGAAIYRHGWLSGYDQYYPFCYFEVADIADSEQTISEDTFTITRVYRDETDIVQARPTRLTGQIMVGDDAVGGIRMIVKTTVMRLSSDKQPEVKMLVCGGGFDHEPFAELPTVDEIRHTLGDIARLDLAPGYQAISR
ncbi:MAG: hypothetical protein OQL16_05695 [Gammaproteobacteria bacterium]|nr:hypothetical protein [Gammaproteobacteria bacterium]